MKSAPNKNGASPNKLTKLEMDFYSLSRQSSSESFRKKKTSPIPQEPDKTSHILKRDGGVLRPEMTFVPPKKKKEEKDTDDKVNNKDKENKTNANRAVMDRHRKKRRVSAPACTDVLHNDEIHSTDRSLHDRIESYEEQLSAIREILDGQPINKKLSREVHQCTNCPRMEEELQLSGAKIESLEQEVQRLTMLVDVKASINIQLDSLEELRREQSVSEPQLSRDISILKEENNMLRTNLEEVQRRHEMGGSQPLEDPERMQALERLLWDKDLTIKHEQTKNKMLEEACENLQQRLNRRQKGMQMTQECYGLSTQTNDQVEDEEEKVEVLERQMVTVYAQLVQARKEKSKG
ncbi:golgi microtubule-associated protein, isoform A [Planoprotostelium fungivorum]|uniref:Golgi microtubule-associated protein, isoform A n=1 Tax=Planoprotostelium fungivorum TaxID=1890364 RepID=A0A2P6NDP3_9EUKA|nr:golgi microtubule-associated protein, isoform A [Planoprotostelium fungivorum]